MIIKVCKYIAHTSLGLSNQAYFCACVLFKICCPVLRLYSVCDLMVMEHQQIHTDRVKQKYSKQHLSHCDLVHQNCNTDYPGTEPRILHPERMASNCPSLGTICYQGKENETDETHS